MIVLKKIHVFLTFLPKRLPLVIFFKKQAFIHRKDLRIHVFMFYLPTSGHAMSQVRGSKLIQANKGVIFH